MSPASLFEMAAECRRSGRLLEAASLLERAVRAAPANAVFLSNLGDVYRTLGRLPEAGAVQLLAIARAPDVAEYAVHLARTFEDQGELAAAAACCERARELAPGSPQVAEYLARLALEPGAQPGKAPVAAKGAASGMSAPALLSALGETLRVARQFEAAAAWYRLALKLDPGMAAAHTALGAIHVEAGRFDEAIDVLRRALDLDENFHAARGYLATALCESGLPDAAQAMFREAVKQDPADADAHSALLFNLPFWPGVSAADILAEARAWNARHAHALAARALPHETDRSPERRLRIGYVSPDFRTHVLSLVVLPLLQNHAHERFEIFCYSSVTKPDHLTARIRGLADVFREVSGLDDAALAALVRQDRIDILVDLTMHMSDRRLLAFARRPAPVQLCWFAYPGTTGLETMDYRFSDPYLDPPDTAADEYSEQTVRLQDTFWCYDPLSDEPAVSALPALETGRITLGCFNHFRKVNDAVLGLWARVLGALDGSRLMLLAPTRRAQERVRETFDTAGIAPDRIEFVERCGRLEYLRRYHQVDLCLDTFPYNGHTTSLDAFWMGVPTVTLVGETVVGRAGLCQAMNLALPELIAKTPDDYVRAVSALASDLDHLATLRGTLRERLKRSPLMDGPRFAQGMESAYRDVWRRFCEGAQTNTSRSSRKSSATDQA